mgnify:CR=1 FL=1
MKSKIFQFSFLLVGLMLILLTSCEKKETKLQQPKKLSIITTLFPTYDFTREIVKDKANVSLLLPPGVEPHSFNPKPSDITEIHKADVFIITNIYMEPWATEILKGVTNPNLIVVDSSKGIKFLKETHHHSHGKEHKHEAFDPHIWLDFSNALIMIDNILEELIKKDPANAEFYKNNAENYKLKLIQLDEQFKNSLSNCKKNIFISGGHLSFSYFANRYNLKYLSAYGVNPEAEPTPRELKKIINLIKKHNLKYIFYEELITPRIAETISKETGVQLLMLHSAHNISKDDFATGQTFLAIMEKNLMNLKKALECL